MLTLWKNKEEKNKKILSGKSGNSQTEMAEKAEILHQKRYKMNGKQKSMDKRKRTIKKAVRKSLFALFEEALKAEKKGEEQRAIKYIKMLFDLVKKYRIRVPSELKNRFCRKCFVLWNEKNARFVFDQKNDCFRVICRCGFSKRL